MFQILTDAAGAEGTGMFAQFLPLILIIVFFYFFLIRPQRKREKETQQMRSSIEVGDEIVLSCDLSVKAVGTTLLTKLPRSKVIELYSAAYF